MGDVCFRTAAADDKTFGQQLVISFQDNRTRNAQLLGQVAWGRQAGVGIKCA